MIVNYLSCIVSYNCELKVCTLCTLYFYPPSPCEFVVQHDVTLRQDNTLHAAIAAVVPGCAGGGAGSGGQGRAGSIAAGTPGSDGSVHKHECRRSRSAKEAQEFL